MLSVDRSNFVALGEVGAADDENEDDCYSRGEQETDIHSSPEQSPASIRSHYLQQIPPHQHIPDPVLHMFCLLAERVHLVGEVLEDAGVYSRRGGTATVEEPAEEQWSEHHQIFLLLVPADM